MEKSKTLSLGVSTDSVHRNYIVSSSVLDGIDVIYSVSTAGSWSWGSIFFIQVIDSPVGISSYRWGQWHIPFLYQEVTSRQSSCEA